MSNLQLSLHLILASYTYNVDKLRAAGVAAATMDAYERLYHMVIEQTIKHDCQLAGRLWVIYLITELADLLAAESSGAQICACDSVTP